MPFVSQSQAGWAFATGQPFARRWAKQTGPYKRLPYKVRKKALAELATTKDYEQAGAIAERLSLKGESLAPGVTRIHGDLCNVHGRWGSCRAAGFSGGASKRIAPKQLPKAPTPKKGSGKKGGGKGGKARKPIKTEAQKRAEQDKKRQERAQAHAAAQQANRTKVLEGLGIDTAGQAALRALQDGQQPDAAAIARGGFITAGLVEQANDGSYRLTASGRAMLTAADSGGAGRAGSTISSARDRTTARTERQTAADKRKQAAAARRVAAAKKRNAAGSKPKPTTPAAHATPARAAASRSSGGGSGGGSKPKTGQSPAQQSSAPATEPASAQPAAIPPALVSALQDLRDGKAIDPTTLTQLVRNGLAGLDKNGTPYLTPAGIQLVSKGKAMRPTTKAPSPGDYLIVEDPTKPSTYHLQVKRNGTPDHGLMGASWAALHSGFRGNVYAGPSKTEALTKLKRLYASEGMPLPSEKSYGGQVSNPAIGHPRIERGLAGVPANGAPALHRSTTSIPLSFTVFKDATGVDRWLARTTTAFEDRDGEVLSAQALQDSADSLDARGPLRWWHAGRPNPLDPEQPWGPGVDLGWCDFAAVHGRTLIESGTFKSAAIARAVADHADQLELSPGFFHAAAEPDAAGVFHHIRIFERSLVPTWAGRASNYYTGLKVQGGSMDPKKIEALQTLGLPEATIKELLGEAQQAEKSADDAGVRYKESRPVIDFFRQFFASEQPTTTTTTKAEADAPPDPLVSLKAELETLRAEIATLKAPAMMASDAEDQAEAPETPGETPDAEDLAEAPEEEGGLTLSPEDLTAIGQAVASALEPLIGALGITQKLDGHMGELKTMLGGFVKQKDDEASVRANEIAALKASIDQQQAKLAELIGDAPRAGYRPTQATDNIPGQVLAAIKDQQASGNGFDDLTAKLFPGMLPG